MPTRTICIKTKKRRFRTRLEADLDRARIHANASAHRRQPDRPLPGRSYLCPSCGGWHLTSSQESGIYFGTSGRSRN